MDIDCLGKSHRLYNLSHISSTCFQCSLDLKLLRLFAAQSSRDGSEAPSNEPGDNSVTFCTLSGRESRHRKEVLRQWFSLPAISDGPQAQTCTQALLQPTDMTQTFQNTPSMRGLATRCSSTVSTNFSIFKQTPPPHHNRSILCICKWFFLKAYYAFCILQVQINPQAQSETLNKKATNGMLLQERKACHNLILIFCSWTIELIITNYREPHYNL